MIVTAVVRQTITHASIRKVQVTLTFRKKQRMCSFCMFVCLLACLRLPLCLFSVFLSLRPQRSLKHKNGVCD